MLAERHTLHLFVDGRRVASSRREGLGSDTSQGPPVVDGVQFYHPGHVGSNAVLSTQEGAVQYAFHAPFGGVGRF